MHPGTAWRSKRWPVESYQGLAKRLAGDMPVVVGWGSAQEKQWADEISRDVDVALVAPETTLLGFAALARRAAVHVGSTRFRKPHRAHFVFSARPAYVQTASFTQ